MSDSDQFDLGTFPWPGSDDDLLDVSGPWTGHAILDWQRDTVIGRMEGYRRAAEVLVQHALEHRADLDFLIYPVANCWRHHIELQLKYLLPILKRLLGEPAGSIKGHDVVKLWDEVQPRLASAFPEEPRADSDNVGRLLRQLHNLDPDGQNFRYHRRTDGSLALTNIGRLDIQTWHKVLVRVSNFLSAAADHTSYHQEIKDELERDMRWGCGL